MPRLCALLALSWLAAGCSCRQASAPVESAKQGPLTAEQVRSQFEAQMKKRGFSLNPLDAGLYDVSLDGGVPLHAYIGNLQRNAVRDDDPSLVPFFVEQLARVASGEVAPWSEARARLFFKLEPNDYDFHGALHWPVSPRVDRLLTLSAPGSTSLQWVTKKMLGDWGITVEEAEKVAGENLDRLLATAPLEVDRIDEHKLGMVPLDSPFKASVILAPNLRSYVEKELGWPILAVTPCRDFLYLHDDSEEFARRGASVVLEEYAESGYPITTEVWRISDGGLETIGAFGPVSKKKSALTPSRGDSSPKPRH